MDLQSETDLQLMSPNDLYGYLGVPVKLEIYKNEQPIFGNVYTIDPVSRSVILAQFDKPVDYTSVDRLVLVPGSSIKWMHEIADANVSDGSIPCSEKVLEIVDKLIKDEEAKTSTSEDDETIAARYDQLINFLRSKNVPFNEQNQTIEIGPVRIVAPYRRENCLSTNPMSLERTQQMLSEVLN